MKFASGVAVAVLLLAGSVGAQAPTAGTGIQGDAPLDVSGDNFEYVAAECRATYLGNVEMVQGTARMRTPRVDVYYPRQTGAGQSRCGSEVERIEAAGPVYYVTPEQQARGNHGVFTAANDTIVLTGDVVLTQGQNVMTGARAVMNTRTRDARVESGPSAQSNGRVRSVLFPEQNQQPRPAAPAQAR